MNIVRCKNCENQFTGKFCNHCGQSADTDRINYKFVFVELKKTFIQFNSGFFYTLKGLILNPGKFIKEYIEGKRIKFTKPFAFLIIACGLDILVYHYLNVDIVNGEIEGINKSVVNTFVAEHYAQIQILLLPIYAFVSILLFRQRPYNFFEFIIIHCYLAGERILINITLIPILAWLKDNPWQVKMVANWGLFISYSLMIWAYTYLFKEKNTLAVIAKTICVQLITVIITGVLIYYFIEVVK